MNFKEFVEEMRNIIQASLGEEYVVSKKCVEKNNEVVREGIGIRRKDSNTEACMYLELAYAGAYMYEKREIDEIAHTLISKYKESEKHDIVDVGCLMDWEWCKERLHCKLINTERNQELLKKIPHRPFLDLSIVYYIIVDEEEGAFMQVRNENLSCWGQMEEDLYYFAMKNVQKEEELRIEDIDDILKNYQAEGSRTNGTMFVCTNRKMIFGAIMLTWDYALEQLRDKLGPEYVIIPASVNEIIGIPMRGEEEWKLLANMVHNTNEMMVDPEEVLSDCLYGYRNGKVEILMEAAL